MIRRPRLATLAATILLAAAGCSADPSPLSPLAAESPERSSLALSEMSTMAERNRQAEAAFYRKNARGHRAAPAETTTNPSPSTHEQKSVTQAATNPRENL